MLTPEQIDALRDRASKISDPMNEFLLQDIARRIAGAGQLTSTAAYQVYRAQQLNASRKEIKEALQKILDVSKQELEKLLTQAAEVGYNFDLSNFSEDAVSFAENAAAQQMVDAAVKLAQKDFTNLTQTKALYFKDSYGKDVPVLNAYQKAMDYAFEQTFTGAADYQTAIRQATKNLADYGVRVIDYKNGIHTGIEAVTRRNIMGGLGLMTEQIGEYNHDQLGADGWEISAHAGSAPDHEPYQGRQYTDKEYKALNARLARRIGTLNCGHAAFPIILGVNEPQYSKEQLQKFKTENKEGVSYQGRQYTKYEATQKQRQIERVIRKQKNRCLVSEAAGDKDQLQIDQIRLTRLNDEYRRFSKSVGLRTERERAQVAGFGKKQANTARSEVEKYYRYWSKSIGANDSVKTLADYYDMKYNNSPEYDLLKRYARGVESGWISPNANFGNYSELHHRIETEIVGKTTTNGIQITGQSEHFMQRVLGTMEDPEKKRPRSGVLLDDVINALQNPVKVGQRRIMKSGKASIKFTGGRCQVSVNPDDGILIQVNPRRR